MVEPAETPVVQEGPAKPEPENKQAEVEKNLEVKTEEAPVQQPQVEEKSRTETAGNKGRRIETRADGRSKKSVLKERLSINFAETYRF